MKHCNYMFLQVCVCVYSCPIIGVTQSQEKESKQSVSYLFSSSLAEFSKPTSWGGGGGGGRLMCTGSSLDQLVMVAGGNLGEAVEE